MWILTGLWWIREWPVVERCLCATLLWVCFVSVEAEAIEYLGMFVSLPRNLVQSLTSTDLE